MSATATEESGTRRLAADSVSLPDGVTPSGTRGALLGAALRLFAERGYAGASIRDIAAGAGVQSATLYAHYPSKAHVLAELIEIGHTEHHERLRAALLGSQPDPAEQLAALVRAHVLTHAAHPMLAVVANTELHALDPEFVEGAWRLRKRSEELFHDVVARGVSLGTFEPIDPWLAVAAIGGMGLRVAHWFSKDSGVAASNVADTYARFALRIVGVRELDGASSVAGGEQPVVTDG